MGLPTLLFWWERGREGKTVLLLSLRILDKKGKTMLGFGLEKTKKIEN